MAWWHWRREVRAATPAGTTRRPEVLLPCARITTNRLAEECEAFLSGGLVEHIESRRAPVWTWTNLLAHGTEEELRAESFASSSDEWRKARAYLASSLLALASTCGPLEEIQKRVLIPLELELAARPEVEAWEPRGWASAVERAFEAYRRQCRRSPQR